MLVVEAKDLEKRYNGVRAVQHLSLQISAGEIYGLLGPNGSGKTTAILILLGLTEPTAGEVRVCGCIPVRNPLVVKRRIGYLPENVGFYDDLTGRENLRFTARLNGIPDRISRARIEELIGVVGLTEAAHRPVGTFSRGMRQRLGIADVLINHPEVKLVEIQGHTDDRGGAKMNMELSKRRAEAVRGYLISAGVNGTRLTAKGFGSRRPKAINITAQGRARNRRVEFHIKERLD